MLERFGFDGPEVTAVVTTRHGGVSAAPYDSLNLGGHVGDDPAAVAENRARVAAALGVGSLVIADQQHTATAAVVTDPGASFPATDALVTDRPGVALAVLVADCTPVLLWDPVRRAVGAAHCGRPGVIAGVLPTTIALMASTYGTDPADLVAGVGPGVCRESYEVTDVERDAMEAAFPGAGLTTPTRPGHALLDVPGGVRHQLAAAGVTRVEHLGGDTATGTDAWFSHRAVRPTGRFAGVVVLR